MITREHKFQEEITQQLYEMRTTAGLTQAQLAKKLGWVTDGKSSGNVSKYENGKRQPNWDLLARWAQACGFQAFLIIEGPSTTWTRKLE